MSIRTRLDRYDKKTRLDILSDLTIFPKETKYGKREPMYLYDIDDTNQFLFLPFSYSYHHATSLSLPSYPNDDREFSKSSTPYSFQGTLNDIQTLIRKETFSILNRTRSLLISLHCGAGKTAYAIYLASKLHYPTCILAHRVTILHQWKYSIEKFTPQATVQILTSKNKLHPNMDFYIINTSSVEKRPKSDFRHIGVLIVDEAHTICTPGMAKSLYSFFPKYLIGLTATPLRSDHMNQLLDIYFGPDIIRKTLWRPFNVYTIDTTFCPKPKLSKTGDLDWNEVLNQQCTHSDRNHLILSILCYFSTRVFLVLCKRKQQTSFLYSELKRMGEDVDVFVASAKKFNYESRILLSTYSKTSTGFDHTRLNALIIASDIEENIEQSLGRVASRSSITPIVFELNDKFRPLWKHMNTRFSCYSHSGGRMVSIRTSPFSDFYSFHAYRMKTIPKKPDTSLSPSLS